MQNKARGMKVVPEICGATCHNEFIGMGVCQLPMNHKRKHRQDGFSWTDAGAERVAKEFAERQSTSA